MLKGTELASGLWILAVLKDVDLSVSCKHTDHVKDTHLGLLF